MKRKPVPRGEVGEVNKPANNNKSPMDKVEDMSKTDQQRGSDTELAKYLNEIREMILKNKHKAAIAKRLGLTGLVKVSFKIEAPNKLKELKIIKSSGKRPLDDSAVETVRRIGELPEIPLNLKLSEITINLEMEFE